MTSSESPPAPPDAVSTFVAALRPFAFPFWLAPLLYFLLSCVFLWRSSVGGDVFLPADLLKHVAPYNAGVSPDSLPPWNPLRWDGIAQFYPWRLYAANTIHEGIIPLWNPRQFCGTPFAANSQSAVLYPGNVLFTLLPVARAFAWSAILHLTLAGWFTFLLLTHLKRHPAAAFVGGLVFAFSAWQIQWLQLPTFLATSCWLPLVLRQTHLLLGDKKPMVRLPLLSLAIGMMLLAGHLQIAFYCLLATILFALFLLFMPSSEVTKTGKLGRAAACGFALIVGAMFALPQILPALELSRMSHRAGKPSIEGYGAYSEYALPPAGLLTLFLPNFYGNDYDADNTYWGYYTKNLGEDVQIAIRHNAAETANFVGVTGLVLGLSGCWGFGLWGRRIVGESSDWASSFFVGLATLSLLMALGTPINRLFYFGVPGFGQSGSPARSLVLWALSVAVLAGYGLHRLIVSPPTKRELQIVFGSVILVFAVSLSLAARRLQAPPQGMQIPILGEVFGRIGWDAARTGFVLVAAILLLTQKSFRAKNALIPAIGFGVLILIELFSAGMPVNPTAKIEAVFPETPGIKYLVEHTEHERIAPINQGWSLYKSPPAVLPPNAGMVYGLRDVQGYDSLLTRQYKEFANKSALPNRIGTVDASPAEVGNMVFFQNPASPLLQFTGARFVVMRAAGSREASAAAPSGELIPSSDTAMQLYAVPQPLERVRLLTNQPQTKSNRYEWKEDYPNRIVLYVDSYTSDTRLVLADQWYPGWKAFVDGKEVAIERDEATGIFRQIAVPLGQHTVMFRYSPVSFRLGVYLACVAALICVTGTTAARLRRE